jgi:hypothetical protein
MRNQTEELNRSRGTMLTGSVIGFGLWWGSQTLNSFFEFKAIKIVYIPVLLVGLAGWAVWVISLYRMMRIRKALKQNPEIAEALNDEYYSSIRLKSFAGAFWGLLILQAALIPLNMVCSLSTESILYLNIFVGVLTPQISFVILDREPADD